MSIASLINQTKQVYSDSFSGIPSNIWKISIITLINKSGTMVIPFLTIYLTQELGFSKGSAGWIMAAFGLGSVLGAYLGGFLTDKVGHYKVQFWTLFLSGFSFFLLIWAKTFWGIAISVFVIATIGDAFRPAMMVSISAYSSEEMQTRSLSLIRMAVNGGFALGPAIGGLVAYYFDFNWLFVLDGITCITAALLFWKFVPNIEVPEASQEEKEKAAPQQSAYSDKVYLLFMFYMMCFAVAFLQLFFTVPVYYREACFFEEWLIGLLLAANGTIIFLIEMPLVYMLENKYNKIILVSTGTLMMALSFGFFLLGGSFIFMAILFTILISVGEIITFPFSNSFALTRAKLGNKGQYMGMYSMTFALSFIIAPPIGFYLAEEFNFNVLWASMLALAVLASFGFLSLRNKI